MVEIGLDRVHHGFWQYFDSTHVNYKPGNKYEDAVRDYYSLLDDEIGYLLEELDDETTVIVMSDHGAKSMAGGIRINEWLIQEGYLKLKTDPEAPTPFSVKDVDWSRTKAWAEGGYYSRLFINLKDREPEGIVPSGDYDTLRNELAAKLEAIPDHKGNPLKSNAYKPEEIYREVRNVAPDLIVYFGDLDWRAVAQVGTGELYTFENDTGPDGANHAQEGIFIMTGPGVVAGKRENLQLVDCGPTVLSQLGVDIPKEMIGQPIH